MGVIVLRDISKSLGLDDTSIGTQVPAGGFGIARGEPAERNRGAVGVEIEVAESAPDILSSESDEEDIVAYADHMPLMLIEPMKDNQLPIDPRSEEAIVKAKAEKITWGIREIGAEDCRYCGDGVTVAVLDTGINRDHQAFDCPDLEIVEKDFTHTKIEDEDGHGTHCAGTIFGRDVEGVRIGVAPGVKRALIGKVIGGGAGADALLQGLDWALSEGAQVISMSLGFDYVTYRDDLITRENVPSSAATSRALNAYRDNIRLFDKYMAYAEARSAIGQAAIIVAATGNDSRRPKYVISKSSPAAAEGVLSVGAVARVDNALVPTSFSNTNPDLVGPGLGVVSAGKTGGLAAMNGTSMACPHIAGLAALYWQSIAQSPAAPADPDMVISALRESARVNLPAKFLEVMGSEIGNGMPIAP